MHEIRSTPDTRRAPRSRGEQGTRHRRAREGRQPLRQCGSSARKRAAPTSGASRATSTSSTTRRPALPAQVATTSRCSMSRRAARWSKATCVPNIGAASRSASPSAIRPTASSAGCANGRIGLEFGKETLMIGANDERERFVSGRRDGEHAAARRQERPRAAPRPDPDGAQLHTALRLDGGQAAQHLRGGRDARGAGQDLDPW